jgi:hypothetical protein
MASYKWTITGNGTIDGADNLQTVKVNSGAPGSYTLSLLVTNINGCEANCSIQVTVKGCVPICTYTQGYYGNAGGLSCFDNPPLNTTQGALKMAIAKPDPLNGGPGGMATFGKFSNGQYWRIYAMDIDDPAKETKEENIFKMLPGGGKSQAIKPGSPVAYRFTNEQSWSYVPLSTKIATKGKIGNTLLTQTMTLYFSIQNSSPLAGTELIGASVVTQKVDCGTKIAMGDLASHTIGADVVAYLNNNSDGYSNTVLGLYKLANDYLGGFTRGGLSADAVAGAVGAINEAFDECRIITGWNGVVEPATITRTTTSPAPAVGSSKETGVEVKGIQVSTFPNPFVNKVRFVIKSEISGSTQIQIVDMQGRLIQNAYKGYINAGREQAIEVNINTVTPQSMIYKVTIGDKVTTGKLMRINQ